MRTIGMLLGIPEEDQQAIRNNIDEGLRLEEGVMPEVDFNHGDARIRTTAPTSTGGSSTLPTTS